MAINKEVDIDLAIEQLELNHNMYTVDRLNKRIVKWFEVNTDERPTDEQINAAWEDWKNKHGSLSMLELRRERNKRLQESDWMAVSDRTMTDEQKAYRQALRDLPANQTPSDTMLSNITWPTEPT